MAKLDIDFVLIDESVVANGFRALMSGAELDAFKKNPVMLFMHNRPPAEFATSSTVLTIGRWYDIRVEGDRLLAKPDFDDNDPFALKIQSKVRNGYYNAASVWIDPVAASDDEFLKLAGQEGPTVTRWGVLEASIVDIPNCRNALAIRNESGELLKLSEDNQVHKKEILDYLQNFIIKNDKQMDIKFLAVKLGLDDKADEKAVLAKLNNLVNSKESDAATITKLTQDKTNLQAELKQIKEAAQSERINQLVNGAVKAGKILEGDKAHYLKLAKADFETTTALLGGMQPVKSIKDQLAAGQKDTDDSLTKLSWDELDRQDKLTRLWETHPEVYRQKFKEQFGKAPNDRV